MRLVLPMLIVFLLAGCASDAPAATGGSGPGSQDSGDASVTTLRFKDLNAPVDKQFWLNGTVAVQDTCNTGACILDTSRAQHSLDLSGEIPLGAPVLVDLELTQTRGEVWGNFEVWIDAPDGTYYTYAYDADHATGRSTVSSVLQSSGTVRVHLLATGPGSEVPEAPFSIAITVRAGPELVLPGAPVGIHLAPGTNLTFTTTTGQKSPMLVYGPDDAFVGAFDGTLSLDQAAKAGEYVVIVPPGGEAGNLTTDGDATEMRVLRLQTSGGPEGVLPPTGPYEKEWSVTGFPVAVGVIAQASPGQLVGDPLLSLGYEFSLTGENGLTLTSGLQCGGCLTFGDYRSVIQSGTGDPLAVAQLYTVHAMTTLTYEVRLTPYAVYLDRA